MNGLRKCVEAVSSDLDRFVSEENIAHYRRLLDVTLDETERRTILRLLADQMASLSRR